MTGSIGFRNGFGIDISIFKQPFINSEDGVVYIFDGFQVLLPFMFVQIGSVKEVLEE